MKVLAIRSAERGLWESMDLPTELRALYEAEAAADHIRCLEMDYLPGLVQTPQYIAAAQAHLLLSQKQAQAVQDVWARRQSIVFSDPIPRVELIFGQSALLYLDKLPDVRDGQIARLRELDELPEVTIRVITSIHAAMTGAFTIMTADRVEEPFVFLEALDGCRYAEEPDVVSRYERTFTQVRDRSTVLLKEFLT